MVPVGKIGSGSVACKDILIKNELTSWISVNYRYQRSDCIAVI